MKPRTQPMRSKAKMPMIDISVVISFSPLF